MRSFKIMMVFASISLVALSSPVHAGGGKTAGAFFGGLAAGSLLTGAATHGHRHRYGDDYDAPRHSERSCERSGCWDEDSRQYRSNKCNWCRDYYGE